MGASQLAQGPQQALEGDWGLGVRHHQGVAKVQEHQGQARVIRLVAFAW
jgi:hypothetical protein